MFNIGTIENSTQNLISVKTCTNSSEVYCYHIFFFFLLSYWNLKHNFVKLKPNYTFDIDTNATVALKISPKTNRLFLDFQDDLKHTGLLVRFDYARRVIAFNLINHIDEENRCFRH